jgi:hypothetical protein
LALASAETYSETKNTAALVKWRVSRVSEVTRNSIDIAYQQFRSLLGQMPASTLQQLRDEHATGTQSGAFIPDKIMLSSSIDLTVTGMDESVDEDKEGTSDKETWRRGRIARCISASTHSSNFSSLDRPKNMTTVPPN